jgi:hypothetical protein
VGEGGKAGKLQPGQLALTAIVMALALGTPGMSGSWSKLLWCQLSTGATHSCPRRLGEVCTPAAAAREALQPPGASRPALPYSSSGCALLWRAGGRQWRAAAAWGAGWLRRRCAARGAPRRRHSCSTACSFWGESAAERLRSGPPLTCGDGDGGGVGMAAAGGGVWSARGPVPPAVLAGSLLHHTHERGGLKVCAAAGCPRAAAACLADSLQTRAPPRARGCLGRRTRAGTWPPARLVSPLALPGCRRRRQPRAGRRAGSATLAAAGTTRGSPGSRCAGR